LPDDARTPKDNPQAKLVHEAVEAAFRAPPREGLRPARTFSAPASRLSPNDSALRANPYPEVTDRICRLPLPTLFYWLEAVNLGDLMRIWVRPGTKITPSPSDFQGPARAHRTPRRLACNSRTQNWYGPGESDCLIKTKHCDGRSLVLTQCDFCPVL